VKFFNIGKKGLAIAALIQIILLSAAHAGKQDETPVFPARDISFTAAVPRYFPPHYYVDKAEKPYGFAIEVMNHVAAIAGLKVHYKIYDTWDEVVGAIEDGEADVIPNMAILEKDKGHLVFSTPIELMRISIFRRAGEKNVESLAGLRGKRTGTLAFSAATELVEGEKGIAHFIYDDYDKAIFELLTGQLDYFVHGGPLFQSVLTKSNLTQSIVPGAPLAEFKRGIAVHKGNEALLAKLDAALKIYSRNGDFRNTYFHWYGPQEPFMTAALAAKLGAAAVLLTILFMAYWRYRSVMELNTRLNTANLQLASAKEQAEEATRLKDKFVSLVAHDLKSPFSSLIGLLKLMDRDSSETISTRNKQILTAVIATGERMYKMIEELLNLTRLKSGVIKPVMMDADIGELVSMAVDKYSLDAAVKGVSITNEIKTGEIAFTDPLLMEEVVSNLLSNAVKFTNAKGTIRVYLARENGTAIVVEDSGVGVSKEFLPHLFSHEVKTSALGTEGEKGTGFGLPLCHEIMAALGGKLTVTTEEGKGSAFYIYLPDQTGAAGNQRLISRIPASKG